MPMKDAFAQPVDAAKSALHVLHRKEVLRPSRSGPERAPQRFTMLNLAARSLALAAACGGATAADNNTKKRASCGG